MAQNQGKVKFFNEAKGYGFIKDDESQAELFVHATALKEQIKQDDVVNFDIEEGKKGKMARWLQTYHSLNS